VIERSVHDRGQQLDGVIIGQAADQNVRYPLQGGTAVTGVPDGEEQCDPFGVQSPGHQGERVEGFLIKPLGVVDHAERRPFGGGVGEERQGRQADEEPVRGRAVDEPEGGSESVAQARWQLLPHDQERDQQPVQPREIEFHLRLDTGDTDDPETARGASCVVQQRCLADTGLAPQHQSGAQPPASRVQGPIQGLMLRSATQECHEPRLRTRGVRHPELRISRDSARGQRA
jgi:hypothetical protein